MKNMILILGLLLFSDALFAQQAPIWSSSLNSNFDWYMRDTPSLKINGSGDIIMVGNVLNEFTGKDVLVARYTSDGDIVWTVHFNSSGTQDDEALDFAIDTEDGILITGRTVVDSANTDLLVLRIDANGDLQWVQYFDGVASREDVGQAITVDASGAAYIAGYTTVDDLGHRKLLVYKVDAMGVASWDHQYGSETEGSYHGQKISLIGESIHVIGNYIGPSLLNQLHTLHLDMNGSLEFSNYSELIRPPSCYHQDEFGNSYLGFGAWERFKVMKFNSSGVELWRDTIGTNMPPNHTGDEIQAIVVDESQNVYVTGRHYGSDFDGPTFTNSDIMTVKYSADGTRIWVRRYDHLGFNAGDIANAIALDEELNVYVAGYSQGSTIGTDYDYVVVKYAPDGTEVGVIRYDSGDDDAVWSIVVDENGSIYVTGLTFEEALSNTTTQKYDAIRLGMEVRSLAGSVQSHPNPFTGSTVISFDDPINELLHFQLLDAVGKVMFESSLSGDRIVIDGGALEPGQYIGVLRGQQKHGVVRIIRIQ